MSLIDLENRYFNGGHGGPWVCSNDTRVVVHIDGEQYFRALNAAINSCSGEGDVIYFLNWSLISSFRLLPATEAGSMEIGQQLAEKAARGVDVRSVIWVHQFFQTGRTIARQVGEENTESAMRMRALTVGTARPLAQRVLLDFTGARLGGNHQKAAVVKAGPVLTAFVSGLDFNSDRWDSNQHPFSTDPSNPRGWHDAGVQVWGETARHVWRNFRTRWRECRTLPVRTYRSRSSTEVEFNPRSSTLPPDPADPPPAASPSPTPHVSTQVLRNYSDIKLWNPVWTRSLNLSWMDLPRAGVHEVMAALTRAINTATQYIYIEDQYGYAPFTLTPLVRSKVRSGVKVIMVLPGGSVGGSGSGSGGDPSVSHNTVVRAFIHYQDELHRPRMLMSTEMSRLAVYRLDGIFIHSKVILIDDQFMSIGSANFADRSMGPSSAGEDAELNVAVVDDSAMLNLVRETRKRLWAEHFALDLRTGSVNTRLDALTTALPFWRANWAASWHSGDPPNPDYQRGLASRLRWVGPEASAP